VWLGLTWTAHAAVVQLGGVSLAYQRQDPRGLNPLCAWAVLVLLV
jgi:hypothetical protein